MNIHDFTAFDLRAFRPYAKAMLRPLLVASLIIIIATRNIYLLLPGVLFFAASIIPQYIFSMDERAKLDLLYASLPVTRRNLVFGRYLMMILLAFGLTLVSLMITLIVAPLLEQNILSPEVGMLVLAGLAGFGFFIAVQLPIFFALGYTRARPWTIMPAIIIFLGVSLGGSAGNVLSEVDGCWEFVGFSMLIEPWVLLISVLVASVVALAISGFISARLYARREF